MAILRAGLFERVSTEEQSKFGYSIQTQIDALEKHCKDNKLKIVDHYCDEGVSGGKPYTKRPEMKRLIDDVRAGKIDIILFTRLDRWFRNVKEYFKVQDILDDAGVQWKAIWEDYDTTTSNGRMAITIFLAIAQNEREKTSERITVVFDNKRQKKESFFGKSSMPFGYMEEKDEDGITRLVKDPELKDAVQDFWDLVIKYENVTKAFKYVNLTYGLKRTKKLWFDVLRKEIYTGDYRGVTNYCEPYVSRKDWLKIQDKKKIKETKNSRIYLFTGLIRCPECGGTLKSTYTKRTCKNGNSKEYMKYRCDHGVSGVCKYKANVYETKAEIWLLNNLDEKIKDEIAKVEIARTLPKPKPRANINNLKEDLRRLEVVYRAGNKSDDQYIVESNELNAAIREAEKQLTDTYDPDDRDLTLLQKTLETDFRSIYETLDREDKRRFWRELIKAVYVDGTEIVDVDFN